MKIAIDIPDYDAERGLLIPWFDGTQILVAYKSGEVTISANNLGLKTLAMLCMTLYAEGVPIGAHIHLDDGGGLDEGSVSLIIEKTD